MNFLEQNNRTDMFEREDIKKIDNVREKSHDIKTILFKLLGNLKSIKCL